MATFGKEAVRGLAALRRAFKAMPEVARDALLEATEETAEHVRAGAVRRVPVRYGFLRSHIDTTISRRTGVARVGVTKGKETRPDGVVVEPRRYAHLVEFGGVHNDATHFMLNAAEGERLAYLERCRKSGVRIERNLATIGGRND